MKKLTMLLLMLLLALAATAGTTTAAPVDDLSRLAAYVPAQAPFFAAIRADDAYFDTLDALLLDPLKAIEGADIPPEASFKEVLMAVFEGFLLGSFDFEQDLRPAVGDTIALTLPSTATLLAGTSANPITLIIDVADMVAAAKLLNNTLLGFDYISEQTEDGFTLYTSRFPRDPAILLTDEVIIVGDLNFGVNALLLPGADALRLSNSDLFKDTMAALPGDDYNIVAYINPDGLISQAAMLLPMMLGANAPRLNAADLSAAVGTQALGFTILQERALVLDYAALNQLSAQMPALNLDLLGLVPAQTPLLIQGQGIGNFIRNLFTALELLEDLLVSQGVLPIEEAGPFGRIGPTHLGVFIRLAVEGSLMIDLETTLDWMNGDFMVYSSLLIDPEAEIPLRALNGTLIATDNPEATAQYVAGQAGRVLNVYRTATFEDGLLTIPVGAVISRPETNMMTSTDNFYVSGASELVEFALDPGESLLDTPTYAFEAAIFLESPTALWYIDMAPIRAAFDALLAGDMMDEMMDDMMDDMMPMSAQDIEVLRAALGLLDSSSFTNVRADGLTTSRFTLTLGG